MLYVFQSMESLANASTNVAAFGLYSFVGLLLLPAVFATLSYPRWLAWLGAVEWGIAAIATGLLVFAPSLATGPLLVSFALYAPWVWGSAIWLLRRKPGHLWPATRPARHRSFTELASGPSLGVDLVV